MLNAFKPPEGQSHQICAEKNPEKPAAVFDSLIALYRPKYFNGEELEDLSSAKVPLSTSYIPTYTHTYTHTLTHIHTYK